MIIEYGIQCRVRPGSHDHIKAPSFLYDWFKEQEVWRLNKVYKDKKSMVKSMRAREHQPYGYEYRPVLRFRSGKFKGVVIL